MGLTLNRRSITLYLVWVIAALFTSTLLYLKTLDAGGSDSWLKLFLIQLLVWSIWGLLSPLIFWLGKRFRIDKHTYYSGIFLHIAFAVILVLFYLAAYSLVWNLLGVGSIDWPTFATYFKLFFLNLFHWHFFIYMAIIAVAHAIQYQVEWEERSRKSLGLEKALLYSELNTLKAQLSPHFLFNTINNVVSTIEQGKNGTASGMLLRLGSFLRCTLEESEHKMIPLEREMDYLGHYLEIERFRNQELEVIINIPPEFREVLVPNFILQPIIENAIKHGISKSKNARRIEIGMEMTNGFLRLWVYNEGPLLEKKQAHLKEGVGLKSTRSRLEFVYGRKASLKLLSTNSGVVAEFLLPITTKG